MNVSYGDHKFPSESCSQHSNITNKKVANSRAKEIENQGCTEMNINIKWLIHEFWAPKSHFQAKPEMCIFHHTEKNIWPSVKDMNFWWKHRLLIKYRVAQPFHCFFFWWIFRATRKKRVLWEKLWRKYPESFFFSPNQREWDFSSLDYVERMDLSSLYKYFACWLIALRRLIHTTF